MVRENPLLLKLVRCRESHTHTHTHKAVLMLMQLNTQGRRERASEGAALADADELNREHCITITDGRGGRELQRGGEG